MAEVAATRSAALALADERALMRQGYQFLDEKRMLLAAEMLRRLAEERAIEQRLRAQLHDALAALQAALRRHGLQGLHAYPPRAPLPALEAPTRSSFLGVALVEAAPLPAPAGGAAQEADAIDASPEANACADAFAALLEPALALAACAGNLERLGAEYRRTERRARALENVLLPETEAAWRAIDEHLQLADQEEAVRIRLAGRGR